MINSGAPPLGSAIMSIISKVFVFGIDQVRTWKLPAKR